MGTSSLIAFLVSSTSATYAKPMILEVRMSAWGEVGEAVWGIARMALERAREGFVLVKMAELEEAREG